jgi:hypothetical protein
VVAVAMDPRGRDELGEGLEELERREQQLGAAVGPTFGGCPGFREAVEKTALGRGGGVGGRDRPPEHGPP